jgi:hypothetical protein
MARSRNQSIDGGGRMSAKKPPKMTSDLHRMDSKYSCRFAIKEGQIWCKWHPKMPSPQRLRSIVETGKYHAARHIFLTEMAARIGGAVVCLEL